MDARRIGLIFAALTVCLLAGGWEAAAGDGGELYRAACAACHGEDGRGAPPAQLGFEVPVPDFTECNFATREPDADWVAIAHQGGPNRAFSRLMPAFGDALTVQELQQVMDFIRGFCDDRRWPRGELNLPRAMFTEKAYPEDEAVFTTSGTTGDEGEVTAEIVYEKRFGARNQLEVVVPFAWREQGTFRGSEWDSGVGDVAVGVKRVLFHDFDRGSILSVTGEVILPTGDDEEGFGKGTTVFEPFLSYGQLLARNFFFQAQVGLELPTNSDRAEDEAFWRGVLGRTFTEGPWGRAWSPMLEVLGGRELVGGETINWDVVPQFQVTLNQRQHVMANVAVRIPLNNTAERDPEVFVYVLWDWFDGGLLEGW
jgi:hypothetical protein